MDESQSPCNTPCPMNAAKPKSIDLEKETIRKSGRKRLKCLREAWESLRRNWEKLGEDMNRFREEWETMREDQEEMNADLEKSRAEWKAMQEDWENTFKQILGEEEVLNSEKINIFLDLNPDAYKMLPKLFKDPASTQYENNPTTDELKKLIEEVMGSGSGTSFPVIDRRSGIRSL